MTNKILQIKNLSIGFQTDQGFVSTLKNINFDINQGETLALVGESGGGKSITALAIMQLLPAAARVGARSQILLDQQDLLELAEIDMRNIRGRKIGMIFQEAMTALNPVLTIGQQIDEVLKYHFKLKKKLRYTQAINLLTEVGIVDPARCYSSYPHELSGGMRQRSMIAMALAGEPRLLIADEPTTALDVTLAAQVIKLLKNLQTKHGMSLLFITHDLGLVYQIADSVAVIHQGEIVEQTSVQQFFASPQHAYSKRLFAALPSWNKREDDIIETKLEQPLLEVENLKIHFPVHTGIFRRITDYIKAVDDVSFSLYPGRTLALVGESGSGKTTIGKGILRLLKPSSGKINFAQHDLVLLSSRKLHALRSELQIIFQDPYSSMNPRMMVKDIIEEGMLAQGIGNNKERQQKIDEMLQLVGLPATSKFRYPHEFSGGQRQRICIARSLVLAPKLIVCDEPTSALDVSVQMQILKLLQRLQLELGLAYLLITHNFAVVAYLAHDVAVMRHGKIVEQGPVEEVLNNPKHPYTKKLLASVPMVPEMNTDFLQGHEEVKV